MSNRVFESKLQEAEYKAIDALSRYKFIMFGYWAAIWVHHAKEIKPKPKNPFSYYVNAAKGHVVTLYWEDDAKKRNAYDKD